MIRRCIAFALCALAACAPVVPQGRSKPGGAARWAAVSSWQAAALWASDAQVCRIAGAGIGVEGWLPDAGGYWQIDYWAPSKKSVLRVMVDADGKLETEEIDGSQSRGRTLPRDWLDSSRVWEATRSHQRGDALNTLESELAWNAEPQRFPGQVVWRIRFFLDTSDYDTHVVTPQGQWLVSY